MPDARCRVYWGTHGCVLERGHHGHHWCSCCPDPAQHPDGCEEGCVGAWPYYGPQTNFYGDDAPLVLP